MPEQNETDPQIANQICVVGEKTAVANAVAELEKKIKGWEDEGETQFECDSDTLREVRNYVNSFFYPELENVKIFFPARPNADQATSNGNGVTSIKPRIRGPKGCLQVGCLTYCCVQLSLVSSSSV